MRPDSEGPGKRRKRSIEPSNGDASPSAPDGEVCLNNGLQARSNVNGVRACLILLARVAAVHAMHAASATRILFVAAATSTAARPGVDVVFRVRWRGRWHRA